MRKFVILLLGVFTFTGCSIVPIKMDNLDQVVSTMMNNHGSLSNQVFEGYKYYLPKGVTFLQKADYNAILLDKGKYYYLYVDAVSYYHKIETTYQKNTNAYFSRELSTNGKRGYIEINKRGNNYFIEAMYNYSKIEALVGDKEIEEAVLSILTILTSVSFNNQVLATMVGDNVLNYKEEIFSIFQPKREESEFLEIVKEFGTYQGTKNELPDEDQIPIIDEIK